MSGSMGAPPERSDGPTPMTLRDPRRPFTTSPFSRLARTHAFGIAGDAMFAIGLAGSVFFSLDFNSARWRVALYLILTIAPFAVAAPLIGPMIDRIKGGRRWIIIGSMAARAVLCFFVVRHLSSLLFYPEAFMMLVLGKVYSISKSAVVPSTVNRGEELVEANSKLTVISAIAVVVAAGPAGLLLKLGGPGWALGLGAITFAVGTAFAFQLPRTSVGDKPVDEVEREELRSAGIMLASSAMALVRGVVGFLAFMLAFDFKNGGAPLWYLGIVAATAQIGFFLGAIAAPRVRRVANEEQIIIGTLVMITVAGFLTSLMGGLQGAALLSAVVGATSSAARQAFDAIVQRDAPDANRGRTFARFEMRFQLIWVVGALLPIVIPIPAEVGFSLIAFAALFAVISYSLGLRHVRHGRVPVRRKVLRRRSGSGDVAQPPSSAAQISDSDSAPPDSRTGDSGAVDEAVVDPTTVVEPTLVTPGATGYPRGSDVHRERSRTARPSTAGAAIDRSRRGWVRPPVHDWEPPPGFVTSPLTEDSPASQPATKPWPKVFDDAPGVLVGDEPVPTDQTPGTHVQIELPLDDDPLDAGKEAVDPVAPVDPVEPVDRDSSEETISYPEPVWRDTPLNVDPDEPSAF